MKPSKVPRARTVAVTPPVGGMPWCGDERRERDEHRRYCDRRRRERCVSCLPPFQPFGRVASRETGDGAAAAVCDGAELVKLGLEGDQQCLVV